MHYYCLNTHHSKLTLYWQQIQLHRKLVICVISTIIFYNGVLKMYHWSMSSRCLHPVFEHSLFIFTQLPDDPDHQEQDVAASDLQESQVYATFRDKFGETPINVKVDIFALHKTCEISFSDISWAEIFAEINFWKHHNISMLLLLSYFLSVCV